MAFTKTARKARRESREHVQSLRAEPYYLGDEAWHYGQPEKANPFTVGTEPSAEWLQGWRDAEFESSKVRKAG